MYNQEELAAMPSTVKKSPFLLRLHFSQQLSELRKLSKDDLVSDKALPILESCWEFVQKAFPVEQSELHRKIAYILFNNPAIPGAFLQHNRDLELLRTLIYSKSKLDVTIFKAVVLNAIKDMKMAIKSSLDSSTTIGNGSNLSKPFEYKNPNKLQELTVSFGTGENFLMDLLNGNRQGYSLEQSAVRGIFVSPHDGTQTIEKIEERTELYACNKPFKHFDKPASISFTIATDKLHHINHNAHEVVILAEDLKYIPRKLQMLSYGYSLCFQQQPMYLDTKGFAKEVIARYGEETGKKILDVIKSQHDITRSAPEVVSLSISPSC